MVRLTATQVARHFSDVLNRIAGGEEIEVTRNGATIAVITPPKARVLSAASFRDLIASAPAVDESFAADLRAIRREVGAPESPWPS